MLAQDNPARKWPSAGPKHHGSPAPACGHVSAPPTDPAPSVRPRPSRPTPPLPSDPAPPPSQDPRHLVLMAPFSPQVLSEHGFGLITTHPGGTDLLLRGGLPPAVPEQEPRRVLRPRGTGVSCPRVFIMDAEFTCWNPSPQHGCFLMVTLRKE